MAARIDLDRLNELVTTTKLTSQQIADEIGCSRRQVERYKERWGRTHRANDYVSRRVTAERLAEIATLINEGYPNKDIAKRLHVHEETIQRHFPGSGWSPAQTSEYRRLLRALDRLPTTIAEIRRKQNQALAA